eukprot:CAMPEP_0173440422 /NCGR_PEP_ID=MMETSP1357-20121228/22840_1 /TAXON_ID=77926 /ORGANISM="Hemiselmis rufescens, Strain PCC563" /LENGTH=124 /DNA_ID=CAMNT_0014405899 /DNA_START=26 /DNA_END=397 /DNA_ORIENTATION=+
MQTSALTAVLLLALCASSNAFSPSLSLRSPFAATLRSTSRATRTSVLSSVNMQEGVVRGICPECGTPVTTTQPREKIDGQYYHTQCVTSKIAREGGGDGGVSISAEELAELRNLAAQKAPPAPP